MQRASKLTSLFFWGLGLCFSVSSVEAGIPSFLKNFPKASYHKLISGKEVVGKTTFQWKADSENQLRFIEESEIKLTLFQKSQTIVTKLDVGTNDAIEIQNFDFEMKTPEAVITMHGERKGTSLKLKVSQAGKTQTKEIALEEPVLMSATLRPFMLKKGFSDKTAKFDAIVLEPSALATVPLQLTVTKKAENRWQVNVRYLEHSLLSEMDRDGNLLSEKSDFAGLPIEAVPVKSEAELSQLKLWGTKEDLVQRAKVSFPKINSPRTLKTLAVRIEGIDVKRFELTRHRQKLEGNVLKIEVEKEPIESSSVQALAAEKEFEKYLTGDTSTPVFDPVIQKQAKEIVGNESDLWKRALKVHEFVFRTLEKVATISVPNALEVLATKRGDCNEHAVLFTALARAAGIPTRTVVGLVYSDYSLRLNSGGDKKMESGFYYHAWVEVYTGKRWVALDPTWNEVPSDATHLAFVEGGLDQQVLVTALMGKIKLSPAAPLK